MKNLIFCLIFILAGFTAISQQSHNYCVEIPVSNGISYASDTPILGGEIYLPTNLFVSSPYYNAFGSDSCGYYLYQDGSNYGVFLGNPNIPAGVNAYNNLVNIVGFDELNMWSNNFMFRTNINGQDSNIYSIDSDGFIFHTYNIYMPNLPVYDTDSAAGAGGVKPNQAYKTSEGFLRIKQ